MGLFTHRSHNQGRAFAVHRAKAAAERRRALDLFAECLADGGSAGECAVRLGKGVKWGTRALADIRDRLGWQAQ